LKKKIRIKSKTHLITAGTVADTNKERVFMITDIPIILASNSPRRRELLAQAGYNFTVIPSGCNEDTDILIPKDFVMELAARKARDVYDKVMSDTGVQDNCIVKAVDNNLHDNSTSSFIVIGSDTVVALNGRILGKPVDYDDAYNTLNSLSGQTHNVYTGVSIIYYNGNDTHISTFYENTEVTFYPMSHEEITWYLSTGDPMDKAGSYGIQTQGGLFIKEIKGDYNNVVGLPLAKVYHEINRLIGK
jgi:septum formation protein